MAISHKYRTFDQLLADVSIDFPSQSLGGHMEPQQLIKVATRVNYDLGLRIHRTKETLLEVEHSKAQLPSDFKYLNYAFVCDEFKTVNTFPSGTHVDTTQPTYVPAPDGGDTGPCDDLPVTMYVWLIHAQHKKMEKLFIVINIWLFNIWVQNNIELQLDFILLELKIVQEVFNVIVQI